MFGQRFKKVKVEYIVSSLYTNGTVECFAVSEVTTKMVSDLIWDLFWILICWTLKYSFAVLTLMFIKKSNLYLQDTYQSLEAKVFTEVLKGKSKQ